MELKYAKPLFIGQIEGEKLATKIKDYNECINVVSSFYDLAYRRGYDDGVKDSKNKEEY